MWRSFPVLSLSSGTWSSTPTTALPRAALPHLPLLSPITLQAHSLLRTSLPAAPVKLWLGHNPVAVWAVSLPDTAKLVTELLLAAEWHLQNPKWLTDMKNDFFMPLVQQIANYLISVSENLRSFPSNHNWFNNKPLYKSNVWLMRGKKDNKRIRETFNSR